MELREVSPGVYYATAPYQTFGEPHLALLRQAARSNPRRRSRICLHAGVSDTVHEMLIYLEAGVYVRPHRHFKPESLHALRGEVSVICFQDSGQIRDVRRLRPGYEPFPLVRFAQPVFHTVLVAGEDAVVHEVTSGPLRPEDTEWAPWAPAEDAPQAASAYLAELTRRIEAGGE